METLESERGFQITLTGFAAAILFSCGPFLYLVVAGRGLFIYLSIFFIMMVLLQAMANDGKYRYNFDTQQKIFLFCIGYQMLSFLWSPVSFTSGAYAYVKVVIFFLLITLNHYTEDDKKLILFFQTVVAVFCVYQMITQGVEYTSYGNRLSFSFFGVSQDPNYMCLSLLFPSVWLTSIIIDKTNKKRVSKLIAFIVLLFILYGILRTGSRGGLLGAIVGIYLCVIQYRKIDIKTLCTSIIIIALVLLFWDRIIQVLPGNTAERFTMETIMSNGGGGRTTVWLAYFVKWISSIWGMIFGYGNTSGAVLVMGGEGAHNYLIESLFEYGVMGTFILAIFYGTLIKQAMIHKKKVALSGLAATLVLALTLTVGRMVEFWLCITLTSVLISDSKNIDELDET